MSQVHTEVFARLVTQTVKYYGFLCVCVFFRSLYCDRLTVHKNFMVALIIRYTVSVIYYEPYIYGDQQPKNVWFKEFGSEVWLSLTEHL